MLGVTPLKFNEKWREEGRNAMRGGGREEEMQ